MSKETLFGISIWSRFWPWFVLGCGVVALVGFMTCEVLLLGMK